MFVGGCWAVSVVDFVSLEVCGGSRMLWSRFLTALRHRSFVAVLGMVVVIDMALKVGWAMEPWAGTAEDAACEPLGAIVAVGSAAVRSGFVISVGALRSCADLNVDLSGCFRSADCEAETSNC